MVRKFRYVHIFCGTLLAVLFLTGCAAEKPALQQAGSTPAPTATAVASPTAEPTPIPTQTPAPVPTPMISDAWYQQRTEDLRHWMELFGEYDSPEAIEQELLLMEIDPNKPMVALTFDDGPMEGISDEIVDILRSYHCRATFFMRGSRMAYEVTPSLLKKILGAGCEIGNHTWGHQRLTEVNYGVKKNTMERVNETVYQVTDGYVIRSFRPPGGYSNREVWRLAQQMDMAVVLWAQSGNVHERDPEKIAQNVQCQIVNGKELQDGDIILLHDTKPWMVDAVRIIVPQLLEKGYQLVTVQELIQLSERGFIPGMKYHKQNEEVTNWSLPSPDQEN